MRCTVTNPPTRTFVVNGEVKHKSEAVAFRLNGRVDVRLNIGETGEFDLTGDQIGYLDALGLKVLCPEREAPVPVGSKAWRTAVAASGQDPDAEYARYQEHQARAKRAATMTEPPADGGEAEKASKGKKKEA